jgi:hypothetical protein
MIRGGAQSGDCGFQLALAEKGRFEVDGYAVARMRQMGAVLGVTLFD